MTVQYFMAGISLCLLLGCGTPRYGNPYRGQYWDKKNFLRLNDSLWVGRYEVETYEYRDYLRIQNLCNKSGPPLKLGFPICDGWGLDYMEANWPMTLIRHEDALSYCSFVEKLINLRGPIVKVRLPTHEEWRLAQAKVGQTPEQVVSDSYFPDTLPRFADYVDSFLLSIGLKPREIDWDFQYRELYNRLNHFRGPLALNKRFDSPYFVLEPKWYRKSVKAKHNFLGNVAELVAEPGIAVGGSWIDRIEDCTPLSVRRMEKESAYDVGFRIVVVVQESQKDFNRRTRRSRH